MKKKLAKELISKHFEIGSLIIDEAIQCALVTAHYLNDQELINILNEIKLKEYQPDSALAKYWENKSADRVAKQIELFI